MARYVPDSERNAFFKVFCRDKANKMCVDCGAPNPQWATAYFGILFCLECSGKHRSLGTHLTFVRSITMDSWKPAEIASMQAGGNANMIAWWKSHDVDPRAPITSKYAHPATQNYRDKIKAAVAGQEYVEPAAPAKSSSSSSLRKSPKSGSSSLSSSSSNALRKSKKKSSSKKSSTEVTPVTGKMFSFDDDDQKADDGSDDEFESFVSAPSQKIVPNVPDYSDARLKKYEGMSSFGSDDLAGTNKPAPKENDMSAAVDDMFAALGAGWSRLTEVTSQTKEKLAQSVEQSNISGKATSLISSLWAGGGSQPVELYPQPEQRPEATPKDWAVEAPAASDDGGWGAWDGNAEDDEPASPAEDSWGAWSSKPAAVKKKEPKKPVEPKGAASANGSSNQLVDLDFGGSAASQSSGNPSGGKSTDGWDDFAFNN